MTDKIASGEAKSGEDHSGDRPAAAVRRAGPADPKLLELLVCPLTKATLEYRAEAQELVSRAARLAYPIRDGVPIMLPEEARSLQEGE